MRTSRVAAAIPRSGFALQALRTRGKGILRFTGFDFRYGFINKDKLVFSIYLFTIFLFNTHIFIIVSK